MNDKVVGTYGSHHAAYHGLAALRAKVNLKEFHKKRSKYETMHPVLNKFIHDEKIQAHWDYITTFDPLGLIAQPPTMAATTALMTIPELDKILTRDGKIVNEDGTINVVKCAIDYVWNIPALASRLGFDEKEMRASLAEYTQNDKLLDTSLKAYYPPVGGVSLYFLGDLASLHAPATEIAVRVHDACCGSDVFGTDICTCRPYLVFAIQGAVECAQRGGVGIIAYFQKEGRSLGEITKYRVYNARKAQEGGDRAEKYFYHTESIAGIRDARFQEMMPDVLKWLGIQRIDWLLSMSSDKYDAITDAGIDVMQRVSLPDMFVPKGAHVEISAKIASGYHTDVIEQDSVVNELRLLESVRGRCKLIYARALEGKTRHLALDVSKLPKCVDFVIKITKENYPDLKIPFHSRWRHFDDDDVTAMESKWSCDAEEKVRRKLDLVFVSVLLDAGAGTNWKYIDHKNRVLNRSEGLAMATLNMFKDGIFSSDVALPHRVNSHGLLAMTLKQFAAGFQATERNPIVGLESRFELMKRLAKALDANPQYFGHEVCRPGNIVDYVLKHAQHGRVNLRVLWKAIIEGLEMIWPENVSGVRRGDVWVYSPLKKVGQPGSDLVPFHKLSQWLTYSLLEPFQELGIQFDDLNLLTGLAEYRNGGLFIDFEVIYPKKPETLLIESDVGSEFIVEMRALTVMLLDKVAEEVRKKLGLTEAQLPLACVLQGGTWAAGRAIAAQKRPEGAPAPIKVRSSGTVF